MPHTVRAARSRAFAVVVLAVFGAVGAFALTAPAWSITPPTDPNPAPGAPFAITSTVPAVISTNSLVVSGTAGAGESVTVEAVGAGGSTCPATADGAGLWSCTLPLTQQSAVTIQAYRGGGAFTDDYDERTAVTVFPPAVDTVGGGLLWGASTYPQITGTRYAFNQVDVLIDGVAGVCPIDSPAGGPTVWSCTIAGGLAEGEHVVSVAETGFLPGPFESAPVVVPLTVDLTAPAMGSFTSPATAPSLPAATIPLVDSSTPWPFLDGTAEPGSTVIVHLTPGAAFDPYWDATYPTYCTTTADAAGLWSCSNDTGFTPGDVYSFGTEVIDAAGNHTVNLAQQIAIRFVWGPVPPVLDSPADGLVTSQTSLTVSGTGTYGDYLVVYLDGETSLCDGISIVDGQWSCVTPAIPLGTHTIDVAAYYSESYPEVVSRTVTIVAPPVTPPATTPSATTPHATSSPSTPVPVAWGYTLTDATGAPVSGGAFTHGAHLIITASRLPAGSTADAELHSTPIALGSGVVAADGTLRLPIVIPEGVEPGSHTLVVTLTPPGGVASPAEQAIAVAVASGDEPLEPTASGSDGGAGASPPPSPQAVEAVNGVKSHGGLGTPSTIGTTLRTIGEIHLSPIAAAVAGSVAVAFILLVALPAELLQSTIAGNYGRAFAWLEPVRRAWRALGRRMPATLRIGRLGGALAVAGTALLLSFSDPAFGLNSMSLRLFAAIFASLYVVNVAVIGVLRRVAAARYGVSSSILPMPASLLIVAASVLVSRISGIQPGFLFGLVVGVAFGRELARHEEGRLALLGAALMVGLGLAAWLAYSVLPTGDGVALNLARDICAATTLESLGTILVALLPVSYLDGQGLFRWSKLAWALAYGAAIAVFVVVVVPMSDTWGEMSAPYFGWMALFVAFAVVAIGVWLAFRLVPARTASLDEHAADVHAVV